MKLINEGMRSWTVIWVCDIFGAQLLISELALPFVVCINVEMFFVFSPKENEFRLVWGF